MRSGIYKDFLVRVKWDITEQPSTEEMSEYIKDAVSYWGGSMDPDSWQFRLGREEFHLGDPVTVKRPGNKVFAIDGHTLTWVDEDHILIEDGHGNHVYMTGGDFQSIISGIANAFKHNPVRLEHSND